MYLEPSFLLIVNASTIALLVRSRCVKIVHSRWGQVALSKRAEETIPGLRQQEPERLVEARIQQALSVRGDPNLLRIALENLLGNAWKFTSRQPGNQGRSCARGALHRQLPAH